MPCIANSVNEQYECLNFLEVANFGLYDITWLPPSSSDSSSLVCTNPKGIVQILAASYN